MRVLTLLLQCLAFSHGRAQDNNRLDMPLHSYDPSFAIDSQLVEWHLDGAAIPTKSGMMLVPGVWNRTGQIWNKTPIMTSSFEIEIAVKVSGPLAVAEGFALWLSYEDFQRRPGEEFKFFGHRPLFKGLSVLFSYSDRTGKINPSISVMFNDGTKVLDAKADVPTNDGVYYPYANTADPILFRLAVGSMGVLGQLKANPEAPQWTDCFRLPSVVLNAGALFGLTGSNIRFDMQAEAVSQVPTVELLSIRMYNNDLATAAEARPPGVEEALRGVDVKDLLRYHASADNREMAEMLSQVTRMLLKHITESGARENAIQRALGGMTASLNRLAAEMRQLRIDITSVNNSNIHNELQGLRSMVSSNTKNHQSFHESIAKIHRKLDSKDGEWTPDRVIKLAAEKSGNIEKALARQLSTSSWLIIFLIVLVTAMGAFLWKRMRDMEKKHYL